MNAFVFNPGQRLASIWGGFKSVCTCSHTGDGTGSEHRDLIEAGDGHGQCKHADCKCTQFSRKSSIICAAAFIIQLPKRTGCSYAAAALRISLTR